jgi:hypothetical protein
MRIGQLITSFLQGKASPTMTSTIFSPYVDHVMEESKTGYFKGLLGETPGTNRGTQVKTVGGIVLGSLKKILRTINDLLPYKIRPIKSKRRRSRVGYTLGVELYTFRLVWRSHYKPRLVQAIKNLRLNKKWWK